MNDETKRALSYAALVCGLIGVATLFIVTQNVAVAARVDCVKRGGAWIVNWCDISKKR